MSPLSRTEGNVMQRKTIESIRQSSRELVRELDVLKGGYLDSGCTFLQCHILFELSAGDDLTLMDIAERILVDKSNTSRTLKKLVNDRLVTVRPDAIDQRQKRFRITAAGRKIVATAVSTANDQVQDAMVNLTTEEQTLVVQGMSLYAKALRKGRLQAGMEIRPIRKSDNPAVARLIREVMTEFGAVGEGFSIVDPEVDSMYAAYRDKGSMYLVVERAEEILGSAGIGPLQGGEPGVCELQKMFFRPELRGIGMGYRLLARLMDEAKKRGYRCCYIETLTRMDQAVSLYRKFGFQELSQSLGATGHNSCDRWFALDL